MFCVYVSVSHPLSAIYFTCIGLFRFGFSTHRNSVCVCVLVMSMVITCICACVCVYVCVCENLCLCVFSDIKTVQKTLLHLHQWQKFMLSPKQIAKRMTPVTDPCKCMRFVCVCVCVCVCMCVCACMHACGRGGVQENIGIRYFFVLLEFSIWL